MKHHVSSLWHYCISLLSSLHLTHLTHNHLKHFQLNLHSIFKRGQQFIYCKHVKFYKYSKQ